MKLILKIAFGVFLGSIAAYVALNTPGWMRQSREEKARHEIEVREAENSQKLSHLWPILKTMTPEMLLSRCGKPATDHGDFGYYNDPTEDRFITYQKGELTLSVDFRRPKGGKWAFEGIGTAVNTPADQIPMTDDITLVGTDIIGFTCLDTVLIEKNR
jgi:hypothetical protein